MLWYAMGKQHPFCSCSSQVHGWTPATGYQHKKAAKDYLRWQFQEWYSNQILKQLDEGTEVKDLEPVDLQLSTMKPIAAEWIKSMFFISWVGLLLSDMDSNMLGYQDY